ncbi:hypothetical protein ONZ45_g18376 [Pleurotus djamor]|nr:hypothetical protein ONZ45_g18376 [Pleurotus djamor]
MHILSVDDFDEEDEFCSTEDIDAWDPSSQMDTCDALIGGGNTGIEPCDIDLDNDDELTLDSRSKGIEDVEALVLSFLGQLVSSTQPTTKTVVKNPKEKAEGGASDYQKPTRSSRRGHRILLNLANRRKVSENGSPGTRTIYYPKNSQSSSAKPFAQLFRVADYVHEALVDDVPTTKRDLYYKDVALFKKQGVLDRIIDDLAATFGGERSHLNVRATSKGLVSGSSLRIHLRSGETIDITDTEGVSIPVGEDIVSFGMVYAISWVLVVEKDAVFQSLCKLRITDHPAMPGRGLLITGKGYPDVATRQLVKALSDHLSQNVPLLGLVDGDPYGIDILSTYKFGSRSLQHENFKLAAARLEWVGVAFHDLSSIGVDIDALLPITKNDEKKALSMLSRPSMPNEWRRELMRILHTRRKAEIEVLSSSTCPRQTPVKDHRTDGSMSPPPSCSDTSPSGYASSSSHPSGSALLRFVASKIQAAHLDLSLSDDFD